MLIIYTHIFKALVSGNEFGKRYFCFHLRSKQWSSRALITLINKTEGIKSGLGVSAIDSSFRLVGWNSIVLEQSLLSQLFLDTHTKRWKIVNGYAHVAWKGCVDSMGPVY